MDHKGYLPLGYITKTKGLKGEVQLFFQVEDPEQYHKLESVFVEINKKLVPFFIDKISIQKSVAYLVFEDVDHIDKANALVKKYLYISEKQKPKVKKEFGLSDLKGFFITDKEKGEIGIIDEIIKLPKQSLASVSYNGQEVLIPLVEDFIRSINKEKKEIEMDLPDGLLDIYLE